VLNSHLTGQTRIRANVTRGKPILDPLNAIVAHLLASDLAILDAVHARLLAVCDAGRPFDTLRTRLLALGAHLDALRTLRPCLLAFGAHLDSFGPLRGLLAFGALRPLKGDALGARGAECLDWRTLGLNPRTAAATTLDCLRGLSVPAAAVTTRARRCRNRDRQSSDACG